jgi:hypothetical protein
MGVLSILDRSHSVAKPGFSRWMVPPAALCIHLCIGQAYAFSVFNLPMSKLIGITKSAPDDWKLTDLGWIFSIAIFVLGFSAAVNIVRRSASAADFWSAPLACRSISCGSSISVTAC